MIKKITLIAIVAAVSVAFQLIGSLPWWTYLIACFVLGVVLPITKWNAKAFTIGFLSGMITWITAHYIFQWMYEGEIMNVTAEIIGMPTLLLALIIGTIGGILSGLALLSGALFKKNFEKKETLRFDDQA